MTQEAYARIRAEVDELENVTMPQIASDVAAARDEGDPVSYTHLRAPRDLSTSRMPSSA